MLDVEAFVARSLPDGQSKPTSLIFALNVGKDSSGNVFIASGSRSGCHWTMCHVDREKKKIVYGDSLAWSVPVDLLPRLEQFIEHIYGECLSDYSVFECHTSSNVSTEREHKCGFSCASQYPLQTCSNICGVVVLIMAVYACTARSFFSHITTSGQSQAVSPSNVFISAPTRYAKYLRRVIMGWIGEKSINPEHVVPSSFLRPELSHESQSDSDSDLDTPRVPSSKGDIDERDNTAENNEKGLCIQRKAERAGRTESTQSSSEAEDKILGNKQLQKINDNYEKKVNKSENRNDKASQEKYRNIPVKRVGGEKDGKNKGDRDRATDDDGVTCDEKRNCDDSPKHRPGSGEQHRGERGTGKSHQCPECEYSCVKLSNMKRHINRKHTRAVGKRAFQSGKCLCLECGHRCFRIKDLRKHLSTEHGVIFRTEIL